MEKNYPEMNSIEEIVSFFVKLYHANPSEATLNGILLAAETYCKSRGMRSDTIHDIRDAIEERVWS